MVICVCVCVSFHWLCSVNKAVGFVGLMFKRQENKSAYGKSVTVTERVLLV